MRACRDIWNEPDNQGGDAVEDVPAKVRRVDELRHEHSRGHVACTPASRSRAQSGRKLGNDPDKESATTKIQ